MDGPISELSTVSFGAAFVAGLVTVLSPCVLVMLPIIIGTGLQKKWWYPLIVSCGLALGFATVGIFLSQLVASLELPPRSLEQLTVILLAAFGVVLIVDRLSDGFSAFTSRALGPLTSNLSGAPPEDGSGQVNGLVAALALGLSRGIIWAPCAGPTMGAILTMAATTSTGYAFALMGTYALGNALPMLLIAYGGRAAANQLLNLRGVQHRARKILGVLLLGFSALNLLGLDKVSEKKVLQSFPEFFDWVASY